MPLPLPCAVLATRRLRYDDGAPVRAASGIARFGSGWLLASDDATHAARWLPRGVTRLRVFPAVDGVDRFDDASGSKRLKPDLEAACRVDVPGRGRQVLLLGSGSLPNRRRAVLVDEGTTAVTAAALDPLYDRVADALGIPAAALNLEGACVVDRTLRWFQRGNARLEVPSASAAVDLPALLAAIDGAADPAAIAVADVAVHDLGPLAITDAVALADGRILVSAAAEDTAHAVDDGPVTDAAIGLLDGTGGDSVVALGRLPGDPHKVEGLGLIAEEGGVARLVAVVDADDPTAASLALQLAVTLPPVG